MAETPDARTSDAATTPDTLNGWKEIAQYLGRSVRSVQRWEAKYGLPIHRVAAAKGEIIWASRQELDRWRTDRPAPPEEDVSVGADASAAPGPHPPAAARARGSWGMLATLGAVLLLMLVAGDWWRSRQQRLRFEATGPATRTQGDSFPLTLLDLAPGHMATRWTQVPNGNTERLGPPIAADPEGGIAWTLTTDCATETGTHRLWMVENVSGERSNTITLVVLPNPACDRPNPDLAVRGVTVDRARVRAGDAVTVRYVIWNLGTAPAVPTMTRLRLGRESSRSRVTDQALGDHPAPEVAVGTPVAQSATVRIPDATASGVYYVWVVADNESVTIEPSSFNNFARSQALAVVSR